MTCPIGNGDVIMMMEMVMVSDIDAARLLASGDVGPASLEMPLAV